MDPSFPRTDRSIPHSIPCSAKISNVYCLLGRTLSTWLLRHNDSGWWWLTAVLGEVKESSSCVPSPPWSDFSPSCKPVSQGHTCSLSSRDRCGKSERLCVNLKWEIPLRRSGLVSLGIRKGRLGWFQWFEWVRLQNQLLTAPCVARCHCCWGPNLKARVNAAQCTELVLEKGPPLWNL